MIAKNLLVTLLGFLVALTAYFNVQSGIKEDFLGMSGITGYAKPQRLKRHRHHHKHNGTVPDKCHHRLFNRENYLN